jgi:hypothetical protein
MSTHRGRRSHARQRLRARRREVNSWGDYTFSRCPADAGFEPLDGTSWERCPDCEIEGRLDGVGRPKRATYGTAFGGALLRGGSTESAAALGGRAPRQTSNCQTCKGKGGWWTKRIDPYALGVRQHAEDVRERERRTTEGAK